MKLKIFTLTFILFALIMHSCSEASKEEVVKVNEEKEGLPKEKVAEIDDGRISLNLLPKQKRHQLMNMRSHLEAVQTIIRLIGNDEYDKASEIASLKLGSTTEMKMMCASFGNEEFEKLGLSFHESADTLSEILKLKDKNESLMALSVTMNSCISCHATFKQ